MKTRLTFFLAFFLFFSCTVHQSVQKTAPVIQRSKGIEIVDFAKASQKFYYFANGHLGQSGYPFKVKEIGGRKAGEVVRASDCKVFSGMYTILEKPIFISNGNRFSVDVWMDHLGSFTLKFEESKDGGPTTSITTKNTKINQWETLYFDFRNNIFGGPTYSKIAVFFDLQKQATGKDEISYFSKIYQLPSAEKKEIIGNKEDAVKIVVLGSSTAAGTGPSESRNAWVNRYRRQLQSENGFHQVINLAVGGYTTYQLLPTGTQVPDNRPKPSPNQNVTKAISLNPDAVLINLPSNDAAKGFSVEEQLTNYKKILQPLYDKGILVWVSTPQGRNFEKEKRALQKKLMKETYKMVGRRTLDFWTDLADWSGKIKKEYNSGDGIHLNDEGHVLLFREVVNKHIVQIINDKKKGVVPVVKGYYSPTYRKGHALIWQDEFNGNQLDTSIWSYELGNGCPELCGWGNAEKVWYRPENTQVKDGKLIITAKPDKEHIGYWSSSRLVTRGKKNFKFGRIDIRAKLPETQGLWPALWLLGDNRETEGWPYCGEIDMMEERGQMPWRIRGTVFYKGTNGQTYHKGGKEELVYGNYSDNFHVYSINWSKESIQFLVDDELYTERRYADLDSLDVTDNPFLKPFYMLINLAVGGNYLGYPDETSVFPQTLEVDYVRYFVADKYYYCPKVEEKVLTLPPKDKLWIFLMAGQSNMAGRGIIEAEDTLTNPRILTMNKDGEWIYAKEPIHFHTNKNRGLDCGMSFARTLLTSVPDDVTIAIIPSAMGGSSMSQWLTDELYRNQHLWSNLKSKIRATEKYGVFKGMIWHQGESDAKKGSIAKYNRKFHLFLKRLRMETATPNLPVVVGEIGKFQTYRPLWIEFNQMIHQMAQSDRLISIIRTDDLDDKGDQVHFNAEGQRTMGIRYARKMAGLLNLPSPVISNTHKLVSYNVRVDLASDGMNAWPKRKEIFVDQIQGINPDIFGVQEARPNQVEFIDKYLGRYKYVGVSRGGVKVEDEYSAIFYKYKKYKVVKSGTFWLSPTPDQVSKGWDAAYLRICTFARFEDLKTGNLFWVFNTHLDNEGKLARKNSLELIQQKIRSLNPDSEPVILMGDFNSMPSSPLVESLKGHFTDAYNVNKSANPTGTFNGFGLEKNDSKRIDYIFGMNSKVHFLKYEVNRDKADGKYISDHFPVIVEAAF